MPKPDRIQRQFLGRRGPALPAAADWLMDSLAGPDADLGEVLIVVPGGRAQRRLFELLAERSVGRALVPPSIVTVGGLAERLLPRTETPVASGLASLLAWSDVLREAEPALIAQVLPNPPARDDWPGWWALAEQVTETADELGGHLLLVQDVTDRATFPGDVERWDALAELDRRYHALLAERGRIDKHAARRGAIQAGACAEVGTIVLVATADLLPVHRKMLERADAPVHALVFADEQDADGFDGLGGLVASYWEESAIEIDDSAIAFVDRPSDQAAAVLEAIRDWTQVRPTPADAITVGLGDASLSGSMTRTLDHAGLPVRSATGQPVGRARPVLLLRALAEFACGLRFDKLAALVRHPDAEAHLSHVAGAPARPWLTLMDRYATDHLAQRPASGWLGDPDRARELEAVYQAALSLLPDPVHTQRTLCDWSESIGGALAHVYGTRKLNRHSEQDRSVVSALDAIGQVLESFSLIDRDAAPRCTFAQAVSLVTTLVSNKQVPEPGGEPAIELVGFLELLLDDAPYLAITGMNEQHVPEPPRQFALLPEGVRRELGLPGDHHRLARDGYALSCMVTSRAPGGVKLVAGRRSREGDPLLPSRLLLKVGDDTLVERVANFVEEQVETHRAAPMLLTPGKHDQFLIPRPVLPEAPITTLRVTAFRDYLACPYRFYLKHVLGLRTVDDRATELSAGDFGTLAHQALRVLADPALRAVDDVQALTERLGMALDQAFAKKVGRTPAVAARIQVEQLRYRLESLAVVHARLVAEGWQIMHHEKALATTVTVDGRPFTITGQVDRIDWHPELGWRLIDYKTSDTAKTPEQTHRGRVEGVRQWVDLQLPLYLDLSSELRDGAPAELGYLNLPKKSADTAYRGAEWSAADLESAGTTRDYVIQQVRAGVFWPPKQPPIFDDGLKGLCADAVGDRMALIRASGPDESAVGDD